MGQRQRVQEGAGHHQLGYPLDLTQRSTEDHSRGSEQGYDVIPVVLEEVGQQVATHLLPLSPGSTREPANPTGRLLAL